MSDAENARYPETVEEARDGVQNALVAAADREFGQDLGIVFDVGFQDGEFFILFPGDEADEDDDVVVDVKVSALGVQDRDQFGAVREPRPGARPARPPRSDAEARSLLLSLLDSQLAAWGASRQVWVGDAPDGPGFKVRFPNGRAWGVSVRLREPEPGG